MIDHLSPRHQQLLRKLAATPEIGHGLPLGECFDFAQHQGWRLHTAFRNRLRHGSAYHASEGKGRRHERRAWDLLIAPILTACTENWETQGFDAPWIPCGSHAYWHFIECVAPIYFPGGAACGEPYAHTRDCAIHLCFRSVTKDRFVVRYDSPTRLRRPAA